MIERSNTTRLRFRLMPLAGCLLALSAGGSLAQSLPAPQPGDPSANPLSPAQPGPPPTLWIEPRVFATQTYSDNYLLSTNNRRSEWISEVGAGLNAVWNMPRFQGRVDYSLSAVYFARGLEDDGFEQALQGQMLLDAWNNTAFIEADASISNERVSAFGVQPADLSSPVNTTQTNRFRISPFLRGTLSSEVDYEIRYTRQATRSDTVLRSDIDEQGWNFSLSSGGDTDRLGWALEASRNETDYALAQSVTFDQATALVRYSVMSTLQVFGQLGREANDVLTAQRTSYNFSAAGLNWRPMETARVGLSRSSRYFGHGHNVDLEYRMQRVLMRFSDTRDVSTGQLGVLDQPGNLGQLIDTLYQGIESDPVRRAQLVQAELQRLGLPADLTTIPGYLTSSVSLQRLQQLSMTLLTARGAFSLALQRSSSRRLGNTISLGDDFDLSQTIDEKGWVASYAQRLTPRLSLSAIFSQRDTEGAATTLSSRLRSLTIGLTARLAPRTVGSLGWRRSEYSSTSPYRESSIQAILVHRF